jgi:hypothetical protein
MLGIFCDLATAGYLRSTEARRVSYPLFDNKKQVHIGPLIFSTTDIIPRNITGGPENSKAHLFEDICLKECNAV